MTPDETKELEALRAAHKWASARLVLVKSQFNETMIALKKAAPRQALELSRKFEKESAS